MEILLLRLLVHLITKCDVLEVKAGNFIKILRNGSGESKVTQSNPTIIFYENIAWFEVPVDDICSL